jgi:hypothetical protein
MRCNEPRQLASRSSRSGRWLPTAAVGAAVAVLGVAGACTPNVANDPVPDEMEFDSEAVPPRVPQPSGLIVNPTTGRLDFSLVGTQVASDCTMPGALSEAECEFLTYLQSLDGYPTSSHALAPTTAAELVDSTLTVGNNIVVVDAASGALVAGIQATFDPIGRYVTVTPDAQRRRWTVGASYWLAVRGYANGLRAQGAAGSSATAATVGAMENEIVASPTEFLLEQDSPLTCGVAAPADLTAACPAFELLDQPPRTPAGAAADVFQLEQIRTAYKDAGAFDLVAQVGIPKDEVAVLWGFPIHTASVAELDPTIGIQPQVPATDEIQIGVQGSVDPATVVPFIVTKQTGSVVVMDLTAAAAGDLVNGFPLIAASYVPTSTGASDTVDGNIVIKGAAPFVSGHEYGLFLQSSLHNLAGKPMVPAPVSKLLTLRGTLVDAAGHSTVAEVGDADAITLEQGRLQLGPLLDDATLGALTGMSRDTLVYCFAFAFPTVTGP